MEILFVLISVIIIIIILIIIIFAIILKSFLQFFWYDQSFNLSHFITLDTFTYISS